MKRFLLLMLLVVWIALPLTVSAQFTSIFPIATAYDDINDPDGSGLITFGAHTGTYTSATAGWGGLIISNTVADMTSPGYLLTLSYTDDGDVDADFLKVQDNAGDVKLTIQEAGKLTTIGEIKGSILRSTSHVYIDNDAAYAVSRLYFRATNAQLMWDNSNGRFQFNNLLYLPSGVNMGTGDITNADSINTVHLIATGQARADCDLHVEGNIHVNKDSTGADAVIYFGDDDEVASLHWDDANDRFELSGGVDVNSNKITGLADPAADDDAANKLYADTTTRAALSSIEVRGDIVAIGNIAQYGIRTHTDTSFIWAERPTEWLNLEQYYKGWTAAQCTTCAWGDYGGSTTEGADSANAVHPDVLYAPNGLFGYRYWMIYTPFCIGENDENPTIQVSNDGEDWGKFISATDSIQYWFGGKHPYQTYAKCSTACAGGCIHTHYDSSLWSDSLLNPLLIKTDFNTTHLSDPDIFVDKNGDLFLAIRATWEIAGWDSSAIFVISTSNGLVWTDTTRIISEGNTNFPSHLSPAFVLDSGGLLYCYMVETDETGSGRDSNEVVRYTSVKADSGWTFKDTVSIWPTTPDSFKLWHINMIPSGIDEIMALITECPSADNGGNSRLSVAFSHDNGATFATKRTPIVTPGEAGSWDSSNVYRAAGYWSDIKTEKAFELFYSGDDGTWHTAHTTMYFSDSTTRVAPYTDTQVVLLSTYGAYGNHHGPRDSSICFGPTFDTAGVLMRTWHFVDSSLTANDTDYVMMGFPRLPANMIEIDSVTFILKSDHASTDSIYLNMIEILGPKQGFHHHADSIYWADTTGWVSGGANIFQLDVSNTTLITRGDQIRIRLRIVSPAANKRLYFGDVWLKCLVTQSISN